MARMVSRARRREGRGIGERLSELVVYVVLFAAVIAGVRWYFVVYRHSPGPAITAFLGALKAGDVPGEYRMLARSTKRYYPTESTFSSGWDPAQGFLGRLANYTIVSVTPKGDTAVAVVSVSVRKPGQELYEAATDTYTDRYVLRDEADGWRVVLEASKLESLQALAAGRSR
ncbi:MAG: hypothetical protein IT208_08700 [Chthonomonadales bacterium]|nr:hypothetical protein [Chthonomonadales bacterium]